MSDAEVALIGVASALAIGLGGIAVAVWQTIAVGKREAAALKEARRADGYLKLLELIQRRGQTEQDLVTNIDRVADMQRGAAAYNRVELNALSDDSQASALVAAFGTPEVTQLHLDWRSAAEEVHNKLELLSAVPTGTSDESQSRELVEVVAPAEIRARARVTARIRDELGG